MKTTNKNIPKDETLSIKKGRPKMKYRIVVKGDVFDKLVLRNNIKYKTLADKLGISVAYLSLIKNNKYTDFRPSPELRKKILKVLKVKFDDIFQIQTAK